MNNQHPHAASMTELLIDAITQAHMGQASEREREIFALTLQELVKLAKTEKILEMKSDTMTAMGIKDEAKAIIEQAMVKAVRGLHKLSNGQGDAAQ